LRLKDVAADVLLSDTVADFDALAVDVNDDSFRILPLSRRTGSMTCVASAWWGW
jgi:hypothetical protein